MRTFLMFLVIILALGFAYQSCQKSIAENKRFSAFQQQQSNTTIHQGKESLEEQGPVVYHTPKQIYKTPKNIDSIFVDKSERKMKVFYQKELLKIYEVGIGKATQGHKQYEGDLKTPEGLYYIDGKNPNSDFHKNLGISYPNPQDKAYAESGKSPGGDIKIHGIGKGYAPNAKFSFTWGCVSVTNQEIDELYAATPIGIPILIRP